MQELCRSFPVLLFHARPGIFETFGGGGSVVEDEDLDLPRQLCQHGAQQYLLW